MAWGAGDFKGSGKKPATTARTTGTGATDADYSRWRETSRPLGVLGPNINELDAGRRGDILAGYRVPAAPRANIVGSGHDWINRMFAGPGGTGGLSGMTNQLNNAYNDYAKNLQAANTENKNLNYKYYTADLGDQLARYKTDQQLAGAMGGYDRDRDVTQIGADTARQQNLYGAYNQANLANLLSGYTGAPQQPNPFLNQIQGMGQPMGMGGMPAPTSAYMQQNSMAPPPGAGFQQQQVTPTAAPMGGGMAGGAGGAPGAGGVPSFTASTLSPEAIRAATDAALLPTTQPGTLADMMRMSPQLASTLQRQLTEPAADLGLNQQMAQSQLNTTLQHLDNQRRAQDIKNQTYGLNLVSGLMG